MFYRKRAVARYLQLSFFRFVDPAAERLIIDNIYQ